MRREAMAVLVGEFADGLELGIDVAEVEAVLGVRGEREHLRAEPHEADVVLLVPFEQLKAVLDVLPPDLFEVVVALLLDPATSNEQRASDARSDAAGPRTEDGIARRLLVAQDRI